MVFENETSLLDRGLMLVSGENATVSVRLYGKRANLNRLTSSNIIVTADLKAVTEPGKYELEYKVSYPSGITNVSLDKRITPSVTVEAVEFAEKDVPVELVFQGEQQEGLILDQRRKRCSARKRSMSPVRKMKWTGDKEPNPDRPHRPHREPGGDFVYTLMNENSEPVDVPHVETDTGEIHLELPVEHIKEVPLRVELVDGGGARRLCAQPCEIEPATIPPVSPALRRR